METPNSYEALYEQARRTTTTDLHASAEQLRYLLGRVLSLPPRILDRRPDLRELRDNVADDYLVVLRWAGQNKEALAEVDRLIQALPHLTQKWMVERALDLIDSGEIGQGVDLLRALFRRSPDDGEIRATLTYELLGAGQYDEAWGLAERWLRRATDDDRMGALHALLAVATEAADLQRVLSCVRKFRGEIGTIPYIACEWLMSRGHWQEMERQLVFIAEGDVRQVFGGEILRARGDESGAMALWQPLLDRKDVADSDLYAFIAVRLLTGQADEELAGWVQSVSVHRPTNSAALLALVAALAQTGHTDEAVQTVVDYRDMGRLIRPYWRRLPYSFWLRLRRYPMPGEGVEALRPYFVTEPSPAPA